MTSEANLTPSARRDSPRKRCGHSTSIAPTVPIKTSGQSGPMVRFKRLLSSFPNSHRDSALERYFPSPLIRRGDFFSLLYKTKKRNMLMAERILTQTLHRRRCYEKQRGTGTNLCGTYRT